MRSLGSERRLTDEWTQLYVSHAPHAPMMDANTQNTLSSSGSWVMSTLHRKFMPCANHHAWSLRGSQERAHAHAGMVP